jgi:putative transposase
VQEYQALVAAAAHALEAQSRREIASQRRGCPRGVLCARARAEALRAARKPGAARELNPRVASNDKWKRIRALARLNVFVRAYREARAAFCAGVRDVVFPAGTYLLRIEHGVRCAPAN